MSRTTTHFTTRLANAVGSGPLPFCNPTTRWLPVEKSAPAPQAAGPTPGVYHVWRSRDNRKGRHNIGLSSEAALHASAPHRTDSLRETLRGVAKMFVRFPIWDVSYDVATIFTLGWSLTVLSSNLSPLCPDACASASGCRLRVGGQALGGPFRCVSAMSSCERPQCGFHVGVSVRLWTEPILPLPGRSTPPTNS